MNGINDNSPPPAVRKIEWHDRVLDFTKRIYVMGILNATPDSFYPASRVPDPGRARETALRMEAEGADIIDIGGESTRPGAAAVSGEEEARRVLPLIRGLRRASRVMISVDTRRREVAEEALSAGADLVNIVGGLAGGDAFAACLARAGVPVVLMHMRGTPETMQRDPHYRDAAAEVEAELGDLARRAEAIGIERGKIILDPGIGFGKRVLDNVALLDRLDGLKRLGLPVLVGVSRKSFLGAVTGRPVEERLAGTVAANTLAALRGADILRVHDVREAVDVARFVEAVRGLA